MRFIIVNTASYISFCIFRLNTNNIVESSVRVFKDIVLERCKAFNAAALVDFVGNTLEDYQRRRLLKYANVRVSKPELYFQTFCQLSKGLIVQK